MAINSGKRNSAATLCRDEYARVRTAQDSSKVDELIPVGLSNRDWRRIPSCGELRRANQL